MIRRLQSNFQYLKVEIHMESQLYWYFKSLILIRDNLFCRQKRLSLIIFSLLFSKYHKVKSSRRVRCSTEFFHGLVHSFPLLHWGLPLRGHPPQCTGPWLTADSAHHTSSAIPHGTTWTLFSTLMTLLRADKHFQLLKPLTANPHLRPLLKCSWFSKAGINAQLPPPSLLTQGKSQLRANQPKLQRKGQNTAFS